MMFNFLSIFILFFTTVSALFIPRAFKPSHYAEGYLEAYTQYHARYTALDCQSQHGTTFFDQCCHPMLATETLATARGPQCVPGSAALSSASAAYPTSTVTTPSGDDCEEGSESSSSASTPTPAADTPTSAADTPTPAAATPTPAPVKPVVNPASDPETTTTSEQKTSSTTSSSAHPTPSSSSSSGSGLIHGGFGTFFYQNGVAGACGTVHSDQDLIAAIDIDRYGDTGKTSPLCGKQVKIINTANGKSVVVTIADACPTCNNGNSIDMSVRAFDQVADAATGMISIAWDFV